MQRLALILALAISLSLARHAALRAEEPASKVDGATTAVGQSITGAGTTSAADNKKKSPTQASTKDKDVSETLAGLQPVMVPMTDGEPPSQEEWEALHTDTTRASLFASLSDMKSQNVSFMNTRYSTVNRTEGTLAAFGKSDPQRGFDRYGHIAGIDFDVPANSWKQRYALNAAALVKLAGQARFAEIAGVGLDTAVGDRRQIAVTFVGTMIPKDEAVRRLNEDITALKYLHTIQTKRMQFKKPFTLVRTVTPPPEPKIVLANVVMLDAKTSKAFERQVGGSVQTIIHGIGGGLKISREGSEESTMLTPVVRCYRTYSIEFKTDEAGQLELVSKTDANGQEHQVPVVFDLTPDL